MTRKYRPSNGTDGMIFMARFCHHCIHDRGFDPDTKKFAGCSIILFTMIYNINDDKYPAEWIQDDDGTNERCTKFKECVE